jgi:hypothetical protein
MVLSNRKHRMPSGLFAPTLHFGVPVGNSIVKNCKRQEAGQSETRRFSDQ